MKEPIQHQPRKRFGQNFLKDQNIIRNIITAIAPQKGDSLVEIGPGLGALTQPLLDVAGHLDVVEIDRDIVQHLKQDYNGLAVHEADALKFDFSQLKKDKPLRVVGNLPYNISTPLLFHLMQYGNEIKDMHFMLQKEVVDRICADFGTKTYGRLSVMLQYYCKVEKLFLVPPTAFYPQPKVDSAIIRLTPHAEKPFPVNDVKCLEVVVRTAFNQRRKTLSNALKTLFSKDCLSTLDIDFKKRPEQITLSEFVQLSNALSNRS